MRHPRRPATNLASRIVLVPLRLPGL
jgi:hypothetical protein